MKRKKVFGDEIIRKKLKNFENSFRTLIEKKGLLSKKGGVLSTKDSQKILIEVTKCPFCERLIPEDSRVCSYCGKSLGFRFKLNQLSREKQEYQKKLDNLKKRKEELIEEGILSGEYYQQRYNEIMDKLVDIEDMIIQEKIKEGVKKK